MCVCVQFTRSNRCSRHKSIVTTIIQSIFGLERSHRARMFLALHDLRHYARHANWMRTHVCLSEYVCVCVWHKSPSSHHANNSVSTLIIILILHKHTDDDESTKSSDYQRHTSSASDCTRGLHHKICVGLMIDGSECECATNSLLLLCTTIGINSGAMTNHCRAV